VIRDAVPADVPELVAVARRAVLEAPGLDAEQKAVWAARLDATLFERLLGLAAIRVHGGPGDVTGFGCRVADQVELLYVDPAAQGRGIGRRLLADLERSARRGGLSSLRLATAHNAEGFYAGAGYRVVGQELVPLGDETVRRVWMEKRV